MFSFESTIPLTDWDKNKYSNTTIVNLLPAITSKDVEIQLANATGSIAKQFTELEKLPFRGDINFG